MLKIAPDKPGNIPLALEQVFASIHGSLEKAFNFINLRFVAGTTEKDMVEYIGDKKNPACMSPELNNTLLDTSEIAWMFFDTFKKTRFAGVSMRLKWSIKHNVRKREIVVAVGNVFIRDSDPLKELQSIIDPEDNSIVEARRNEFLVLKVAEEVDMEKNAPLDNDVFSVKIYKATLISTLAYHITVLYLLYSEEYATAFNEKVKNALLEDKNAPIIRNKKETFAYLENFMEKYPRTIVIDNYGKGNTLNKK